MDKIRVGLIGFGGMGGMHFSCYDDIDDVELTAICDVRREMAEEKRGDRQIAVYTDLDEMLDREALDMVDICTPSYLHADMIVYCLNRGLHVLCEKPLTLNRADCEMVLKAARESGKKFMVAHVVRFMKQYGFLREVIESGELGNLLSLELKRISYIPMWSWEDWMRDEARSGGVCLDLSVHDLDFVQSVLGRPDEVSAVYRPIKDNSSFIQSTLHYGSTVVTCEAGWYNTDIPFISDFLAVFDGGYISWKDGKLIMNQKEIDLGEKKYTAATGINISGDNAYREEIAYFIDCVKQDREISHVLPESSAESVGLALRILESAKVV